MDSKIVNKQSKDDLKIFEDLHETLLGLHRDYTKLRMKSQEEKQEGNNSMKNEVKEEEITIYDDLL
ncbi:MAG: hypothetical protein ACP5K3_02210 [Candidatus Micrarchaeia archaeon]|jgi:ribosomal protein L29